MSATPALETGDPSGQVGRVSIANTYPISGPLGATPSAQVQVDGSDPAFQVPNTGYVIASEFPGRVVVVGSTPFDTHGTIGALADSVCVRVNGPGLTTVTMPPAPWDGMEVEIKDTVGAVPTRAGNTVAVTITANTGQKIELIGAPGTFSAFAGTTSLVSGGQCVRFRYDQSLTAWLIHGTSDTRPLCYRALNGATTQVLSGDAVVLQITAGGSTSTVLLPNQPADATTIKIKDISGNALTKNITVQAGASDKIEQHTGGGVSAAGGTETIATNWQGVIYSYDAGNGTWWCVSKLL